MLTQKKIAYDFLEKHNMQASNIDFLKCVDSFIAEMDKGLTNNSSLPMIPTYLSLDKTDFRNEKVIVIDAGGTNFRVALMNFDDSGHAVRESFSKHRMPGTAGEINCDEFFKQMAELIRPIINESDKIGFCFSYPLEITREKDGKILYFTKELKVTGAEGKLVGENLLAALGASHKKIVLLNDTVAALLGGVAAFPDRKFGSYAGFILGTGTNTAYIERNENIKKDKDICKTSGSMIINMESGNFGGGPNGYIDRVLTNSTKDPESQLFEKMISGAYLGMNLLVTLKVAAEEGLFSKEFCERVNKYYNFDGAELSEFLSYPYAKGTIADICQNEHEKLLVYYFAENVCERAAKLAAINLSAVVKKSGAGQNPLKPVCILAEGSTFHKAHFIKARVAHYLKKYLNDEMGLYADVLQAEDVTLVGSAIAGLL